MKRVKLEELAAQQRGESYSELYERIRSELDAGRLMPVKASGKNGKKPALYLEYWIREEQKDYSELEEELDYRLTPAISVDYYRRHLPEYEKDRQYVRMLDAFLRGRGDELREPVSVNERSYAIWKQEKFLKKGHGGTILKRCGIEPSDLNYYETSEPLAYYSGSRATPQNLLIVENKDTFYTMRRHLLSGGSAILGMEIGTLIYGAGKGILRSFLDFELCVEPYMTHPQNKFYYFGDLDYEGIGIYENLADLFSGRCEIRPFTKAYEEMLQKETGGETEQSWLLRLPKMKEKQNQELSGHFYSYFCAGCVKRMRDILKAGRYIPQECLTERDLRRGEEEAGREDAV